MSDEPTERDVEALAATICAGRTATGPLMGRGMTWDECGYKDKFRTEARLFLESDWYAERIAETRREGATEITTRVGALADSWEFGVPDGHIERGAVVDGLRAALRGDDS